MKLHLPRRPAFTLIELMVVIGLIIVLATLTVAVANSSLVDSYKIVGGADRLSGWLLTAKQRALRDKTPVGVRLIRDPNDPNFCRQAQLVELPTIYGPNQLPQQNTMPGLAGGNSLPFGAPMVVVRYLTNATGDLIQESGLAGTEAGVYLYWPTNLSPYPNLTVNGPAADLNPGDLIRITELGSTHRIQTITALSTVPTGFPSGLPAGQYVKLTLVTSSVRLPAGQQYPSSPPYPTNLLPVNLTAAPLAGSPQSYPTGYPAIGAANVFQSKYFGLFRASRPILGEPLYQLPTNMAVDVTPGTDVAPAGLSANDVLPLSVNVPFNGNDPEIVFNPNGSVLFSDAGLIGLWLRDTRNSGGQAPLSVVSVAPNAVLPIYNDVFVDRARLMNAGEHVLVTVYTKTGAVATYPIFSPDQTGRYDGRPVTVPGGDAREAGPYKYALLATNTGL